MILKGVGAVGAILSVFGYFEFRVLPPPPQRMIPDTPPPRQLL